MSSMPDVCSSEAEGISSLEPPSGVVAVQVYLVPSWNIAVRLQASYILLHILGDSCLVVRTGKNIPLDHSISPW